MRVVWDSPLNQPDVHFPTTIRHTAAIGWGVAPLAVLAVLSVGLLLVRGSSGTRWATRPLQKSIATQIELNSADHAELAQIPGLGPTLADAILTYRDTNGPFRSFTELEQVHGIGPKTLERLRPHVRIEPPLKVRAQAPENDRVEVLERKPSPPVLVSGDKLRMGETLDLNRATIEELQRLPGIGPKLAERIVEVRQQQPFRTIEDIRRVSGIGVKTLEKLRPFVRLP